jgi:hypothetical protein
VLKHVGGEATVGGGVEREERHDEERQSGGEENRAIPSREIAPAATPES